MVIDRDVTPDLCKQFAVNAYPSMVILNREQQMIYRWSGFGDTPFVLGQFAEAQRRFSLYKAGEEWDIPDPRAATLRDGATVTSRKAPGSGIIQGMAVAGKWLWVQQGGLLRAIALTDDAGESPVWAAIPADPNSGRAESANDIACDGTYLYVVPFSWRAGSAISRYELAKEDWAAPVVTESHRGGRGWGTSGVTCVGDALWIIERSGGRLAKVNKQTGELIAQMSTRVPGYRLFNTNGLAFDGTHLLTTARLQKERRDADGNAIAGVDRHTPHTYAILRINPATGATVGMIELNYWCNSIAVADGMVYLGEQPQQRVNKDHERVQIPEELVVWCMPLDDGDVTEPGQPDDESSNETEAERLLRETEEHMREVDRLVEQMQEAREKLRESRERLERLLGQLGGEGDNNGEGNGEGNGPDNTGEGDNDSPPGLPEGVLWQFDIKADSKGSGAIADVDGDGKPEIVFGTYFNEERLFCVNAEDGSILWTHTSDGGPLDASVAIEDLDGNGTLEVLSADSATGSLYCLHGRTGRLLWRIKLPSGTDSPPAVADLNGDGVKEIVVGSMWQRGGIGAVTCYRADTQAKVWECRIKGCVQSEPCLVDLDGDNILDVIVTSWRGDRGVHALNGKDGTALWTHTTPGNDRSMGMYHGVSIIGAGEKLRVVVSTCNGDVIVLDRTGAVQWTKHLDRQYLFAPTTVGDVNGDGTPDILVGGHTLFALSAEDGKQLWVFPMRHALDRGCALTDVDGDGKLDVVFGDGREIVGINAATGKEVFRFDATLKAAPYEEISSAPLIGDFNRDGKCEAFLVIGLGTSRDDGKGNYGRAMAIQLQGTGPEWTTFRGNLRRTGSRD